MPNPSHGDRVPLGELEASLCALVSSSLKMMNDNNSLIS